MLIMSGLLSHSKNSIPVWFRLFWWAEELHALKLGSQYANADLTQQIICKIEISSILCLTCVCIKLT